MYNIIKELEVQSYLGTNYGHDMLETIMIQNIDSFIHGKKLVDMTQDFEQHDKKFQAT